MSDPNTRRLIPILILVALAVWLVLPNNPGIHIGSFNKQIRIIRGLDLQGGLQVLLEADLPPDTNITAEQMQTARDIIERRVNALGVTEPLVQVAGARRIVVELPGVEDPEEAVATIKETGLLEFIEITPADIQQLGPDLQVKTDYASQLAGEGPGAVPSPTLSAAETNPSGEPTAETTPPTAGATGEATATPSEGAAGTPAAGGESTPEATPAASGGENQKVFHTVMTGADLEGAVVQQDQFGAYQVAITFTPEGGQKFAQYTTNHVGDILGIVLDNRLISFPRIQEPITQGQASISGDFTYEEANNLAIQLRYGSLPIPLNVVENKTVGPTLGEDSLQKSALAGVVGLAVVMLFMATYYRLPGVLADLALLIYAAITFALFKSIPVTLTLPGIAGFVLSIGVAVDANVLIFERLKEELRSGRTLRQAIDLGFSRAWPSIRDSNLSTLITCAILFWFGNTFGASIVKGFSLTLALGVMVSLFTAITVTRTFLHLVLDKIALAQHHSLFGV
jgi:preprotein translocase subunit SecD